MNLDKEFPALVEYFGQQEFRGPFMMAAVMMVRYNLSEDVLNEISSYNQERNSYNKVLEEVLYDYSASYVPDLDDYHRVTALGLGFQLGQVLIPGFGLYHIAAHILGVCYDEFKNKSQDQIKEQYLQEYDYDRIYTLVQSNLRDRVAHKMIQLLSTKVIFGEGSEFEQGFPTIYSAGTILRVRRYHDITWEIDNLDSSTESSAIMRGGSKIESLPLLEMLQFRKNIYLKFPNLLLANQHIEEDLKYAFLFQQGHSLLETDLEQAFFYILCLPEPDILNILRLIIQPGPLLDRANFKESLPHEVIKIITSPVESDSALKQNSQALVIAITPFLPQDAEAVPPNPTANVFLATSPSLPGFLRFACSCGSIDLNWLQEQSILNKLTYETKRNTSLIDEINSYFAVHLSPNDRLFKLEYNSSQDLIDVRESFSRTCEPS